MFEFFDYHRTVVAFHGTTVDQAEWLVDGRGFKPSSNDYDWLGGGIYFWEYAPKQAWWWVRKFKKFEKPAVVGAMIRLGRCLDLLDPANVGSLQKVHVAMMERESETAAEMPKNGHRKKLDCAILNQFYELAIEGLWPIDTARAVYVPTESAKRAWPRSWIYEQAHVQICVRNEENILAVWHVREDGRYGKDRD